MDTTHTNYTSTSTPLPTDIAVNQGLYQICRLLARATEVQIRMDTLGFCPELQQQCIALKQEIAGLLRQELGPYADYLAVGWSKYLNAYGVYSLCPLSWRGEEQE